MLISCPFCGPRDQSEFRCGGQTAIVRPVPAAAISDADWGDYLFIRRNPRGPHAERWLHSGGCGSWFGMLRDTVSGEILAVDRVDTDRPDFRP